MNSFPLLITLCAVGGVFPRENDSDHFREALGIIQRDFVSFRAEINEIRRKQEAEFQRILEGSKVLSDIVVQQAEDIKRLKKDKALIENELHELKTLIRYPKVSHDDLLHIYDEKDKQESSEAFFIENNNIPKNTTAAKRYLLESEGGGIAFSVTLTQADVVNLGQGQTVIYDKVISNLGKGYDVSTGIFRPSVAGWYVFSMTLMSSPGETQELDVVLNGVRLFHCYTDGNEYNSASRTIVAHADPGDNVWVQTAQWPHSDKVHGAEHSSFTGYLIYAD